MSQHYDICIQGSGIVGRTLALLLARERLRVALVSTPPPAVAKEDVRAYALNAASKQLLESLRAWPDAAHATPVLGMQVQGDAKGASQGVVNFNAAEQGVAALAWIVDVPALEAQLAQAVKFQPLIEVIVSAPAGTNDTISTHSHFEDLGIRADLTVICEGKNSVTRNQLAVEFDVTPYHQHAIAARLTGMLPHDGIARQWFQQGEILAFLPLSDHLNAAFASNFATDGNSVALVWSVSPERAKRLMALSADEFAEAVEQASGFALGAMQLYSARASWPLQLARASHWVGVDPVVGSWALAGDAAHTVHPLSGQGLNLGLADVAELAKVLGGKDYWRPVGDMRLLRRYERARKLDVLALGTVTDGLQQLFARGSEAEKMPWQLLRNVGMQGFEHSGGLKHWVTKRAMGL
ncbi:MAG: FAD-dependent monooxygenase [Burkholderiaceae bacterium]